MRIRTPTLFSDENIPFRKIIWVAVGLFGFFTALYLRNSLNLLPAIVGFIFLFVFIKTDKIDSDIIVWRRQQTYADFFMAGVLVAMLVSVVFEYLGL